MTLQEDYDTLLRSQRLYGTGPEQLKKAMDGNHVKAGRIMELEKALQAIRSRTMGTNQLLAHDISMIVRKALKDISNGR